MFNVQSSCTLKGYVQDLVDDGISPDIFGAERTLIVSFSNKS
jgi:hypothetical protein